MYHVRTLMLSCRWSHAWTRVWFWKTVPVAMQRPPDVMQLLTLWACAGVPVKPTVIAVAAATPRSHRPTADPALAVDRSDIAVPPDSSGLPRGARLRRAASVRPAN